MNAATDSSLATYERSSSSSSTSECPFHSRSPLQATWGWLTATASFFQSDRLQFAYDILNTGTPDQFHDYVWHSMPHSPKALFITQPHIIAQIVSKPREGEYFSSGLEFQYGLTQAIGSDSPLTTTNDESHQKVRKFCREQEFGRHSIQNSIHSIAAVALGFVDSLGVEETINFTRTIPLYTLEQTKTNVLKSDFNVEETATVISAAEERITNMMLLHVKPLVVTTFQDLMQRESCLQRLEDIAEGIIKDINATGIIRHLQDSKEQRGVHPFSDEEIKSLTKTILFIGSGTTKSALISALYSLMQSPAIQEELYNGIKEIDLSDSPSLYEQLEKNETLSRFFMELLRLYPPIMFQVRKANEAFSIHYTNEIPIPKGTGLYLSLYHSYRDNRRWEDPTTFNPSRFKQLNSSDTRLQFVNKLNPFSTGHSKCIGEKFAEMSIKTFICALVQQYKVSPPEGMEPQNLEVVGKMTLSFDKDLFVRLEPRQSDII